MIGKNKSGLGFAFYIMPVTVAAWLFFVGVWSVMGPTAQSGVRHFVEHAKEFSYECSETLGAITDVELDGDTLTFTYSGSSDDVEWDGTVEGTVVDNRFHGQYRSTYNGTSYRGPIEFEFEPDGSAVGVHPYGPSRIVKGAPATR